MNFKSADLSQLNAVLAALSSAEMKQVLTGVEQQIARSSGLLEEHLRAGQREWEDGNAAYEARKKDPRKFVDSGDAEKALEDPSSPYRKTKITPKKGRLSIFLKRMENGVNIYDVAQIGRFAGLKFTAGSKSRTVDPATVQKESLQRGKDWERHALSKGARLQADRSKGCGFKLKWPKGAKRESFGEWANKRRDQIARKKVGGFLGLGGAREEVTRMTKSAPRKVMEPRASDAPVVLAAFRSELEKLFKQRS